MSTREWILSALLAAFLVLKLAEGVLGLDSWPLSNVSMFLERRPPEMVPTRAHLWVRAGGEWLELAPRDFRLTEDEFNHRLRDADDLALACGELVRLYDRSWKRDQPVAEAYAEREEIARPGVPRAVSRWRVSCALQGDAEKARKPPT